MEKLANCTMMLNIIDIQKTKRSGKFSDICYIDSFCSSLDSFVCYMTLLPKISI